MRIASLLPWATDIVCSLGAGDRVVACTCECDAPPGCRVVLSGEPIRPAPDSPGPESVVRRAGPPGQSVYTLDTDGLAAARPDVVLAPAPECLSAEQASAQVEALDAARGPGGCRPVVLFLGPTTIEGILDDVIRVGVAIGATERAERDVCQLRSRLFRAQELVTPFDPCRPVVGLLVGVDPLVVAGHWVVQVIERAGGECPWNGTRADGRAGAAAGPQQAQRRAGPPIAVSLEALLAPNPDWVIVALPGRSLEDSVRAARVLAGRAGVGDWASSRPGRLWAVDGTRRLNRPGPWVIADLEWLVGLIQGRGELLVPDYPACRVELPIDGERPHRFC